VELDELHVNQVSPGPVGERVPIPGVFPRVRGDGERPADAACGENNCLGSEQDQPATLSPIPQRSGDPVTILQQPRNRALHEHVNALVDGVLLQSADHLEAGPVADMRQAVIAMAAEGPLEDQPVLCAVE